MNLSKAKEYLPLVQAASEGKTIQRRFVDVSDNTFNYYKWEDCLIIDDKIPFDRYRIKPTPTLRPWKPEEVPVGALIKPMHVTHSDMFIIVGRSTLAGKPVVYFGMWTLSGYPDIDMLLKNYEHSLDHGKTWLPCGVLSES